MKYQPQREERQPPEYDTDRITKSRRNVNWNTILIGIAIAMGGESYREMRMIHDAVLGQNYQISDLRNRQTATDVNVAALKIEMSALQLDLAKWKEHRP